MSTSTLQWCKSSYSDGGGGNCIEVAYAWRKSSYSDSGGGNCVEVADCGDGCAVHVRDSKNPGPTLRLAGGAWAVFAGWAAARP
ncbi:DUF397 domain-containing protein [Streptomyces antarcticus]|uniref:DUF397 domain-containing protein n=1 Tax=Streptomyces antarcticus TaxID=2996458 RepID=UPI0022703AF7|nr:MULTISPECIES: DUF397 domain-containing protein [unclassified Streptomyces]MCY0945939.1 DUF397 domain-containing protein [Streptomyces sp. H34-AA3]MCY0951215.1 DUF397 domain-containing protein [Streptomyces sp. H27-S2]MCZ4083248.1 DUF397 domain-containing protein [Streptomyces sp. H34-S5]